MFFPRMKWVKKTRNCPFYKFRMEIKTPLFTWTTFHFTSPISASKLCMYSWYLRKGFQINPFLFTNLSHIFPQWTFLGIHEPTVTTVYGISHVYTIINHLRHGKKEKKKKPEACLLYIFWLFLWNKTISTRFDTFPASWIWRPNIPTEPEKWIICLDGFPKLSSKPKHYIGEWRFHGQFPPLQYSIICFFHAFPNFQQGWNCQKALKRSISSSDVFDCTWTLDRIKHASQIFFDEYWKVCSVYKTIPV